MEEDEFKGLIKEKDKHARKLQVNEQRIKQIRESLKTKLRSLRKQRAAAIEMLSRRHSIMLSKLNALFDDRIAKSKSEAKSRLFLLKDKAEYSKWQAEKIDDVIDMVFTEELNEAKENPQEIKEQIQKVEVKIMPLETKEFDIVVSNLRYQLKNETAFKKQLNVFLKMLEGVLKLLNATDSLSMKEHLKTIENYSTSKSKNSKDIILENLEGIVAIIQKNKIRKE